MDILVPQSTDTAMTRNLLRHIWRLPRNAIAALLALDQRTLSPDYGPLRHLFPFGFCRHSPTCSQYAKEQILARGAVVGSFFSLKRLLTCHPWKKLSDAKLRELAARVHP